LVAVLQVSNQEMTTAEGKMMIKAHVGESGSEYGRTSKQ